MTSTRATDLGAMSALPSEAGSFLARYAEETGMEQTAASARIREALDAIAADGTYRHRPDELRHGARMAWRNANRCIGRLFWNRMHVFDERGASSETEVFEALLRHLAFATNGGEIRPAITILPPAGEGRATFRIWNHQLLRYAGYERPDGIVGDPASVRFTKVCERLGWRGEGTPFDLLPLVVQHGNKTPRLFDIPRSHALEVPLTHPDRDLFGDFPAKWYAVPVISDMLLEIGGVRYPAAPFNGWYMGTEIGSRNLGDEARYDLLPLIAANLGLDTSSNATLWKDRALLELNAAVLHSYRRAGVAIVDHHTAAQQFGVFERNEEKAGRAVTGRWSWLIPPMSPSATAVFHKSYDDRIESPQFSHQEAPY
ncbi:nitric oxide synthase oxygenase [Cohnella sp. JJ-181]|uniref:nitric oxide synthase oxygenase n=1 Tax=Cohnella rhizoplanae TaxID=2974897 RepID=UPI0022FFAAE5|nr:nitric oxide synthase oxygenase [Cohnella sp. JJ-181]CAI6046415.1 Nitric oxide synthase oxygenase [Cohnella sp. JJ-181]